MAIRYIKKVGGMPTQTAGLPPIGMRHETGSMPGAPPLAPPAEAMPPQIEGALAHPLAPWLLMAGMEALSKHLHTAGQDKAGALPPAQPKKYYSKRASVSTMETKGSELPGANEPKIDRAPSVQVSPRAYSKASALPSTHAEGSGSPLPASQAKEAVSNPPIASHDAEPMDRSADVRDNSAGVDRGVENKMEASDKHVALVEPKIRAYQKRQVAKYALKRPLG